MPSLVPVVFLSIWYFVTRGGWVSPHILPSPGAVKDAFLAVLHSGELVADLEVSSRRALTGLAFGAGLGFIAGVISGAIPFADKLLDSTVQMLRTVPSLAMIPMLIMWFGIGEETKVILVAIATFFPLYLNTYQGIRYADKGLQEMGRIYGLGPWGLFRHVIFPGAIPSVLVGLRFSLGMMLLTLVGAEALAADSGIGYMTTTAREFMRTDVVLLGTLIYAFLGKSTDLAAKFLERRLLPWHPNHQPPPRTS